MVATTVTRMPARIVRCMSVLCHSRAKAQTSKAISTVPTTTLIVSGTRKVHHTGSTLQRISSQSLVEILKSNRELLFKSDKAKVSPLTEHAIRSTQLEHPLNRFSWRDKTETSGRDSHSRMIVQQPTTDMSSSMWISRTQAPLQSLQVHATVITTLFVRTAQEELVRVIPTVTLETSP